MAALRLTNLRLRLERAAGRLNTTNQAGERLFADTPPDMFVASGHGGMRALVIIPSLNLVAAWNDSTIEDQDASPGNPKTRNNRALKLLVEACRAESGP